MLITKDHYNLELVFPFSEEASVYHVVHKFRGVIVCIQGNMQIDLQTENANNLTAGSFPKSTNLNLCNLLETTNVQLILLLMKKQDSSYLTKPSVKLNVICYEKF